MRMKAGTWVAWVGVGVLAFSAARAGELTVAAGQLSAKGAAKFNAVGAGAVELRIDNPHDGASLRVDPPSGKEFWDLTGYKWLAVDVENLAAGVQGRLNLRLAARDSAGEKKTRETVGGIALNPREKRTLRMFLPHRYLYRPPAGVPGMKTMETNRVHVMIFELQWPFEAAKKDLAHVRLSNFRLEESLEGKARIADDAFFPFIDAYGQYKHEDWPEKIKDDAQLVAARAAEDAALAAAGRPAAWNQYGGWAAGPQLEATGHFRTQKHEGKWWLVDPEGRLFFSQGIDVLYPQTDPFTYTGREGWYEDAPEPTREGKISHTHRNLAKKYGEDGFEPAFFQTLVRRLEAWGMNTVGDWGHRDLIALRKMPYTLQLTDYNGKAPRFGGNPKLKFYDVFDPAYVAQMEGLVDAAAAKNPNVAPSLNDPLCIGYFIDNELQWPRGENMGNMLLRCPPEQASKKEWRADLEKKYKNVEALNAAWKTGYADWDAFLAVQEKPPAAEAYKKDAVAMMDRLADQYFRLCRDAIKKKAPKKLYLGPRFISVDGVRPLLMNASKKYCDVMTVNIYAHSAANYMTGGFPDMPMLVGEFQFGAHDRGMFSASLCQAGATQAERATAYTRFVQGALAHPNIVGTHWFQFRDQPLTGRGDGESYPIGFVDVADTTYPELCAAARAVGEGMYAYRAAGKLANDFPKPREAVLK